MANLQSVIRFAAPVAIFLAGWEVLSRMGLKDASLFPPPSRVALALGQMVNSGEMARDLSASAGRLGFGLLLGSIAGILAGLFTGRIAAAEAALSPIIQIFRPLPPVAIIPLVIVWFGIGEGAKIFSIAFAVFFPVWLNTHLGAHNVPVRLLWSASTLTRSRLKIFTRVVFPASLPFINAGLRTGISVAFVMVFVSELAGASEGIGYQIASTHLSYRIDKMIAALAVLGTAGAVSDWLFAKASLKVFPWLRFQPSK